MTDYKRLVPKSFPRVQDRESAESKYWRRFVNPVELKGVAPTSHISFSLEAPHDFAITSSTHVSVHSGQTGQELRSIGRYKDVAYSAEFRGGGKLLASGDGTGTVKVIDAKSKSILRTFTDHSAAARAVRWAKDGLRLASGSDDKTVRLWDLPTASCLQVRRGHTDYVRALAASPVSTDSWVTGSYDHTVKVWDVRQSGEVFTADHGAPVEQCLVLPGGGVVISAGSNYIRVWDMLSGGKLVHEFSNHVKTITCLCLDGTATRLLSGGLDRHAKIYNLSTYSVVHSLKFHAPVLSLALSPDNTMMVAGTTDNVLTIRKREPKRPPTEDAQPAASSRKGIKRRLEGLQAEPSIEEVQIDAQRRKALRPYDRALRKFHYQEALDQALTTGNPSVIVTVLEELVLRRGLVIALSGRDEVSLKPLLTFLARYITNPRYAHLLVDVAQTVCGLYAEVLGESDLVDELFAKLHQQVKAEVRFQQEMLGLVGSLDAVIAAASRSLQGQAQGPDGTQPQGPDDLT